MEKRTLRSSTRAAAAAAATGDAHPEHDKNTESAPSPTSSHTATSSRHRALYKPNPLNETAKQGVTRRVREDAELRKQRRDELISAKRFKRSKGIEEPTGGI
ncbi:hypothetical protein BGZ46_000415 [Entomortierella lignicola]|nr:hypothetical protein BGZ46_000415 [Entomortierella lignicola]